MTDPSAVSVTEKRAIFERAAERPSSPRRKPASASVPSLALRAGVGAVDDDGPRSPKSPKKGLLAALSPRSRKSKEDQADDSPSRSPRKRDKKGEVVKSPRGRKSSFSVFSSTPEVKRKKKKKKDKEKEKDKDKEKERDSEKERDTDDDDDGGRSSPGATQCLQVGELSRVDTCKISELEWDAYRMWLTHVIGSSTEEVASREVTARMQCFLFFYRAGVDVKDIVAQNFFSVEEWRAQGRTVTDDAVLLNVPVASATMFERDGDSVTAIHTTHDEKTAGWWCTPFVDAASAASASSAPIASPRIASRRRLSISHGSAPPGLNSPPSHLRTSSPGSLVSPRRARASSITHSMDMSATSAFRNSSPLARRAEGSPPRCIPSRSRSPSDSDSSPSPPVPRGHVSTARALFERTVEEKQRAAGSPSRPALTSVTSSPQLIRRKSPGSPMAPRSLPNDSFLASVFADGITSSTEKKAICHRSHTCKASKKKESKNSDKNDFMLTLMQNKNDPLLTTCDPDLVKKRDARIKWAIEWGTSEDEIQVPHHLRISSCRVLSQLAYPVEIVPGIRELLWTSGAAPVLLNYARSGEFHVHRVIRESEIEFQDKIGEGAAGTVYLGMWDSAQVAVKVCSEDTTVGFNVEEFLFEAALMCMIEHKHLLPCYGAYTEPPKYLLVSPFQVNGSLESLLAQKERPLPMALRVKILTAIADAMAHLHRFDFIHRDLKSANVLLGENLEEDVFVTDFGTTRAIGKADKRATHAFIGTTAWMAPEMFERDAKQTVKVDVYSFGIVMWEVLSRGKPYSHLENFEIPDAVVGGQRPELQPAHYEPLVELKELYEAAVHAQAKKRPSFDAIARRLARCLPILEGGKPSIRSRGRSHSVTNLFM